MNTKYLMISSSIFNGLMGLLFSFLPAEILGFFSSGAGVPVLILQLLGALYLAFGMMNWTAKENLIGGIYGRAIGMGNFIHFTIGAIVLIKGISIYSDSYVVWISTGAYIIFALLFSLVIFRQPVKKG